MHDFNGTQRGWFENGILRDLSGKCVGFMENANGKYHPVFPSTKISKSFVKLPTLPLKPVSQKNPFCSQQDPKKEWADKNPVTLMIP